MILSCTLNKQKQTKRQTGHKAGKRKNGKRFLLRFELKRFSFILHWTPLGRKQALPEPSSF